MANPGGMDEYFEAMSSPATCMELPPTATTYALADPALAIATGEKYFEHRRPVLSGPPWAQASLRHCWPRSTGRLPYSNLFAYGLLS